MGFFDKVLGGLAGIPGTIATAFINDWFGDSNAKDQYNRSKELMDTQWNRQYGAFKRRYQDTTADMKAAGLNPILAATGGFNVSGVPSVNIPSVSMAPTYVPDISSSAKSMTEIKGIEKDIQKKDAEIKQTLEDANLKNQQIKESVAKTLLAREQSKLAGANERKAVEETWAIESQVRERLQHVYEMQSQLEKNMAETILTQQKAEVAKSQKKQIDAEVSLLKKDLERMGLSLAHLRRIATVYDGPLGATLTHIQEIMKSLGLGNLFAGLAIGKLTGKRAAKTKGKSGSFY